MKRSTLNAAYRDALACFTRHHWALPPNARWDITDFGLGDFARYGLTLVNLATEREYCEKIMFARRGQTTPCHTHATKKEDIICRSGELTLRLWPSRREPAELANATPGRSFKVPVNGEPHLLRAGQALVLPAGSRVTLVPGIWHEFSASSAECIIGEVSTANDDVNDNFFVDSAIGRFPGIEEDEAAALRLVTEK